MKTNLQTKNDQKPIDLKKEKTTSKAPFNKLVLAALFLFSSFLAMPNTSPAPASASVASKKTIEAYLKFPQLLTAAGDRLFISPTLEVLFTTDSTGQINFVLAKTQNEALKREVESQFYKLTLPKLKQNVVHSVTLNFKTL